MIGLPKPRLTATISPPVGGRHALGEVTIHGTEPVRKPAGGPVGRTNKSLRCGLCKRQGHARNNREFHPEAQ